MKRIWSILLLTLFAASAACAADYSYRTLGVDRLLLMNNDINPLCPVSNQGYYDTNKTASSYWEHNNAGNTKPSYTYSYLQRGTIHTYWRREADGGRTPLWYLYNCRAGSGTVFGPGFNYIPWSSNAVSITTGKTKFTAAAGAGSIVMLNSTNSYFFSGYYTNGIGTIYFDAVNATNGLRGTLGVQWSTNVLAGAGDDVTLWSTNCNKWAEWFEWHDATLSMYKITRGSKWSAVMVTNSTDEVVLDASSGSNAFYRVRADLFTQLGEYRGPIRFRVNRTTAHPSVKPVAYTAQILVDNVLVSFPPMTVQLKTYGNEYDPRLTGKRVVGRIGDFTEAFIHANARDIRARAYYEEVTNCAVANPQFAFGTVSSYRPAFYYRWRYLKNEGSWKNSLLDIDKETRTLSAKTTFNATNHVGDLEYYFKIRSMNAPYYKPVEYTAIPDASNAFKSFGPSEEITTRELHGNYAETTPAGSNEFFTRIREGASDYKSITLVGMVVTNGATDVTQQRGVTVDIPFELNSTNRLWRALYHIADTALIGKTLRFHVEGVKILASGEPVEFIEHAKAWRMPAARAKIDLSGAPYSGVMDGAEEGQITLDDRATHLLFEFDEVGESIKISHALYADFNLWTDATSGFMGNFMSTNGLTNAGDGSQKQKYVANLERWDPPNSTDGWWREDFTAYDYSPYVIGSFESEKNSPNDWIVRQGAFVYENFTTNGLSVQLQGQGQGSISFEETGGTAHVPHGIDRVTFKMRAAQAYTFDSFAYDISKWNSSDYAMSGQFAMSAKADLADMSPACPVLSLVGYYYPGKGCYEFRITRTNAKTFELQIWRWDARAGTQQLLGSKTVTESGTFKSLFPTQSTTTHNYDYQNFTTGYIVVTTLADEGSGAKTIYVKGGISRSRSASAIENDTGNIPDAYTVDGYDSAPVTESGSCGVGSCDCRAYFAALKMHPVQTTTAGINGDFSAAKAVSLESDIKSDYWVLPDGRYEPMANWKWGESYQEETGKWGYGLKASAPSDQTVEVMFKPVEGGEWTGVGCVSNVTTFALGECAFEPHYVGDALVRIKTGGTPTGNRLDVVVDDIEFTSWCGECSDDVASSDWVYTDAWITNVITNISGNVTNSYRGCHLQPTRGHADKPCGVRSPYLKNGLSLFNIDYENASATTRLLVQVATNATLSNLGSYTYSGTQCLDTKCWKTLEVFDFAINTELSRPSGTISVPIGYHAPIRGVVRVIVDPEVMRYCSVNRDDDSYGAVTITGANCYDEPELDLRSWCGWNVRTEGWASGIPSSIGYLYDWPNGLSCVLNYSALARENNDGADFGEGQQDKIAEFAENNPFVQSAQMEVGIGQVTFKARRLTTSTSAGKAAISLYTAPSIDTPSEKWTFQEDFVIPDDAYGTTYTWTNMKDNTGYKAIRLVVRGARYGRSGNSKEPDGVPVIKPINRVCIDEVVVSEPVIPGLTLIDPYPFRSHLEEDVVVSNTASMDEQPLVNESWGVQVQVQPADGKGEDIDMESIRVEFHYYVGDYPWGVSNWMARAEAVHADLKCIDKDKLIFRSSVDSDYAGSVVPPQGQRGQHKVVQYLVRVFYNDTSGNPHVHDVTNKEWVMPSWLAGDSTDYNRTYGEGDPDRFSAFTILDSISPRRVWFNELNVYDGLLNYANTGATNQMLEVAMPSGDSIYGWQVELLDMNQRAKVLAAFGVDAGVASTTAANMVNRFSFLTLRSPKTREAGNCKEANGAWRALNSTDNFLITDGGTLNYETPYALRLKRASGVYEHSIVFMCTNRSVDIYSRGYDGTNLLANLRASYPNEDWIYAGADNSPLALGVWRSHGEDASCWTNRLLQSYCGTPTRVNMLENGILQEIDPNWCIQANSDAMWIYASVAGAHIRQVIGDKTNNVETVVIVPGGQSASIAYVLDRWYEVGSVTTNGAPADLPTKVGDKWQLKLPHMRGDVQLVATSAPAKALDGKLDPNDAYTPAIMDWLQQFDDSREIKPAHFIALSGRTNDVLSLRQMYWLDIPPTEGNWKFIAGMCDAPLVDASQPKNQPVQEIPYTLTSGEIVTNVRMHVFMQLTNDVSGECHAPKILRGLAPGETSAGYDPDAGLNWTSVTFKVTGALQKGAASDKFIPLRYFTFGADSFDPVTCIAVIDVLDPFQTISPAYSEGWSEWKGTPVFYRWSLDVRSVPQTVEMLHRDSTYRGGEF